MKYSILIPTHNRSEYILELVNKLLEINDAQIVIVENGSTNDEVKRYEALAENFPDNVEINYMRSGNLAQARIKSVQLAKGKYIWQIDDDDMVTDKFIAFLNSFHPIEDLYRFPYDRYGKSNVPNRAKKNKPSKLFSTMEVSTFLIKRSIFKHDFYKPDVSMSEDQLMGLRIYKECKLSFYIPIDSIIYNYHNNEVSVTRSKRDIHADSKVLNYLDAGNKFDLVMLKKIFTYQFREAKNGIYNWNDLSELYSGLNEMNLKKKTGIFILDFKTRILLRIIKRHKKSWY